MAGMGIYIYMYGLKLEKACINIVLVSLQEYLRMGEVTKELTEITNILVT